MPQTTGQADGERVSSIGFSLIRSGTARGAAGNPAAAEAGRGQERDQGGTEAAGGSMRGLFGKQTHAPAIGLRVPGVAFAGDASPGQGTGERLLSSAQDAG